MRDWLLDNFRLLAVVSLPQTAFSHFGAGVKASLVFLRKRKVGEKASDEEAIFMAVAENSGYDATGRKTMKVVETQEEGDRKTEIQRCDLFDRSVPYHWEGDDWISEPDEVIPDSGILAQYHNFKQNPQSFFV